MFPAGFQAGRDITGRTGFAIPSATFPPSQAGRDITGRTGYHRPDGICNPVRNISAQPEPLNGPAWIANPVRLGEQFTIHHSSFIIFIGQSDHKIL